VEGKGKDLEIVNRLREKSCQIKEGGPNRESGGCRQRSKRGHEREEFSHLVVGRAFGANKGGESKWRHVSRSELKGRADMSSARREDSSPLLSIGLWKRRTGGSGRKRSREKRLDPANA